MKEGKKKNTYRLLVALTALSVTATPATTINAFAWNSAEDVNQATTHPFLVEEGLNVLMNDLSQSDKNDPEFMAVLNQFQSNMHELKRGSVAPDFWASNYALYQDHFYDPYTKQNFTSLSNSISTAILDYVYPTAMYRSKENTGWALQNWKNGNYKEAVYKFGEAMHYYSDMYEPHHASNAIGGTHESSTQHSTFEKYVDSVMNDCRITTLGGDTSSSVYTSTLRPKYYSDFITQQGDAGAEAAQALYKSTFRPGDKSTWTSTARPALQTNQKAVALAIYRFAKEVTNPNSGSTHNTNSTVTLNVRVKTSNITYAGTDNGVYFGVELKNGRIIEQILDVSGNDHEAGDDWTYSVNLKQAAGSEVRKAWIRKQRGWGEHTAEDNWHLAEVEVTSSDNQLAFLKPVNSWIKGNSGVDLYGNNN